MHLDKIIASLKEQKNCEKGRNRIGRCQIKMKKRQINKTATSQSE